MDVEITYLVAGVPVTNRMTDPAIDRATCTMRESDIAAIHLYDVSGAQIGSGVVRRCEAFWTGVAVPRRAGVKADDDNGGTDG